MNILYVHVGKESACIAGDTGDASSIPGSGRIPWRRKCQPTTVFLKNPMDRGAWWTTVQRITESDMTQ